MVERRAPDNVTSHSIRISWAANTNAQFSYYAVFRSTTPGSGINSTLVATVTNQSVTTFTDATLALDTPYYYRVYAVNAYGTFSADKVPVGRVAIQLAGPPSGGTGDPRMDRFLSLARRGPVFRRDVTPGRNDPLDLDLRRELAEFERQYPTAF